MDMDADGPSYACVEGLIVQTDTHFVVVDKHWRNFLNFSEGQNICSKNVFFYRLLLARARVNDEMMAG